MEIQIKTSPQRQITGLNGSSSLINNTVVQLWQQFMPHRNNIPGKFNEELFNVQVYPENYFKAFSPENTFERWVGIEVLPGAPPPDGMNTFVIPEGIYATFIYKGLPENLAPVFQEFYQQWLPASPYQLAQRPHFEILGNKYQRKHPESEEEIWIPIDFKYKMNH